MDGTVKFMDAWTLSCLSPQQGSSEMHAPGKTSQERAVGRLKACILQFCFGKTQVETQRECERWSWDSTQVWVNPCCLLLPPPSMPTPPSLKVQVILNHSDSATLDPDWVMGRGRGW